MKLWTIGFDETLEDFPQLIYKNKIMNYEEQAYLTKKIFNMIILTNRDNYIKINEIISNKNKLPFEELYLLIFGTQANRYEFEIEYLAYFLNYFEVEINS
jgi:hypothetical protein